jgi:hypothetical protein
MSPALRDEITHRALRNCDMPCSVKLTKVLRKALSTKSSAEQIAALGTISSSLAARELDLHDISVTIVAKKTKK